MSTAPESSGVLGLPTWFLLSFHGTMLEVWM
jgi:hypothetical protein